MKKSMIWVAVMLVAAMLAGCGSKEVVMKEFTSPDTTVTISADETWLDQETGVDGWVAVGPENGSEVIMVMQFTKGVLDVNIADLDGLKTIVEEQYKMEEITEMDKPAMEGIQNMTAYSCKLNADGMDGIGYVVYGETDYAYYTFIYAASKADDSKKDYFLNSCTSFKEKV